VGVASDALGHLAAGPLFTVPNVFSFGGWDDGGGCGADVCIDESGSAPRTTSETLGIFTGAIKDTFGLGRADAPTVGSTIGGAVAAVEDALPNAPFGLGWSTWLGLVLVGVVAVAIGYGVRAVR
jgi:hypothetical protein